MNSVGSASGAIIAHFECFDEILAGWIVGQEELAHSFVENTKTQRHKDTKKGRLNKFLQLCGEPHNAGHAECVVMQSLCVPKPQ
ncbi:MAG: hypothetical protein DMG13_06050 [Acidobacteria bacterium]|nr:MAG: hypothetical protein DMG13_06050 [Acidobacteriota bacterium]